MSDTICIKDLEVFYHVGVPQSERAESQRLLITVEMEVDFEEAALSDDISKTVDYFAVTQRLLIFGEGREWKLIEKLAADITDFLRANFDTQTVHVEVKKFIIPQAKWVSVRARRDASIL